MLKPLTIPGLFVTGTDTEVGKTVVAAGICDHFRRRRLRVGACKPIATGCEMRREGLVSPDAELLAHHGDVEAPLDVICPQRFAKPLAPMVASEIEKQPLEYPSIDRALAEISNVSDVMVVEGIGGVMVPLDKKHSVIDMIMWLQLPVIAVARATLGTINHTLLTLMALRQAGAKVAGVVINRYPSENPSVAEETNPKVIERISRIPVLCVVPDRPMTSGKTVAPEILAAVDLIDWSERCGVPRIRYRAD